jgi:O-antigen/teichoic acid export membrane protein
MKAPVNLQKNIFAGSITAGGSIVISVVAYPLYLHFLGAELYGLWVILNVVVYFSTLANFGIDEAIIKFIAEETGEEKRERIKEIFSTGFNILFISSIVLFAVLFLLRSVLLNILDLKTAHAMVFLSIFPYIIILSICIILIIYVNAVLKGLGRYDQASYILLLGRILSVLFALPLLILKTGIWALYWGQLLSYLCVLLVSSGVIMKKLGFFYSPRSFDRKVLTRIMKFGGTLTVSKLLSMLLEPFVKFVIARYTGLSAVTYFEIAHRIVTQIRSLFERGISAIMPEISRLSVAGEEAHRRLSKVMKKVNAWNILLGGCVFVALFFLAKSVLQLWLGSEYHNIILFSLRVLTIAYAINLFSVPAYYYFMGTARVGYCLLNHGLQSGLNFTVILLLATFNTPTFNVIMYVYALSIAISALVLIVLYHIQKLSYKSSDSRLHA